MKKSSTIKCTKIHNALGNLAVNWLWGTMHGQKWYCLNSACMQFLFIHWNLLISWKSSPRIILYNDKRSCLYHALMLPTLIDFVVFSWTILAEVKALLEYRGKQLCSKWNYLLILSSHITLFLSVSQETMVEQLLCKKTYNWEQHILSNGRSLLVGWIDPRKFKKVAPSMVHFLLAPSRDVVSNYFIEGQIGLA